MTAKAWYWTGLGVLILSIGSSNTSRCWMNKASQVIDQLRTKTLPYMAMAEMAMGRTQAGLGHMQAAEARMKAQAARLQAAQARLEADRALAEMQRVKRMDVLAHYPGGENFDSEVAGVSVTQDRIIVRGQHGLVVCPRTQVEMPVVPAPHVAVMQNPI